MVASITVTELPPRDSCSTRVSLELRYGTCTLVPPSRPLAFSASALITLPSAERLWLIFAPSLSFSPVAPSRGRGLGWDQPTRARVRG